MSKLKGINKRVYERLMLRSAFLSLFASAITLKKRRGRQFTFAGFAKLLKKDKSEVSRWFSGRPNWTLNTVSDIADALNLDVEIQARDRETGMLITPSGPVLTPSIRLYGATREFDVTTETDQSPTPIVDGLSTSVPTPSTAPN